jgi:hypothetical protein
LIVDKKKQLSDNLLHLAYFFAKQFKPLNVTTLGQKETDNIKQMITISK